MSALKDAELTFTRETLTRFIATYGGVKQRAAYALQDWPGLEYFNPSTLSHWLKHPTVLAYYVALAIQQRLESQPNQAKQNPPVSSAPSEIPPLA